VKEIKWYISDDGTTKGTRAEVEAYEAALNPLAKFMFPWTDDWFNATGKQAIDNFTKGGVSSKDAVDLLNLMPLVEELRREWNTDAPYWRKSTWTTRSGSTTANLLIAYEKALGIEQPS